jgi:gliding motility-associated-like protein
MKKTQLLIILLIVIFTQAKAQPGPCTANVPVFNIDLTGAPDSSWSMSGIVRDGSCCGYNNPPNSCVKFIITLDPLAEAISFNVTDGALPANLQWQLMDASQTGCDTTMHNANEAVCVSGPGPHVIVFCKPGGNNNTYTITSITAPSFSSDVTINQGCTIELFANGMQDSTITWTSISPGNPGDYNNYLSCVYGCDTVSVTPTGSNIPPYVDYVVCGNKMSNCTPIFICDTIRVNINNTLNVNISPNQPTICFGGSGGTLTANPSGGTPPYNYNWSTGETTQSINVTTSGTYYVEITDQTNCPPVTDTIVVNVVPNPNEAIAGNDLYLCPNAPNANLMGTIIGANGGTWLGGNGIFSPSRDSLITTYSPTSIEVLSGGLDLFLVTTGNGICPSDTDTIHINYSNINLTITDTGNITCPGDGNGYATVAASGGVGPYTYLWNTFPFQTTPTASNLNGGTYCAIVTDAVGCNASACITISEPPPLNINTQITPISCNGVCDGQINAVVTGGTPSYSLSWSNGSNSSFITNLCPGNYTLNIVDNAGCKDSASVTIIDPPVLNAFIENTTNVSCNGACDGSIEVGYTGGTPPITVNWSPSGNTDTIATGLCPGNHTAYVIDTYGCNVQVSAIITEPAPLSAFVSSITHNSCYGDANGAATITAQGGTTPYTYVWNTTPVQNSQTATGLTAGNYICVVTDANGCQVAVPVTINQNPALTATIVNSSDVTCNGGNDGAIYTSVSGGTPNYTYNWNTTPVQNTPNAYNLPAGNYTLTITDARGCQTTISHTVNEPNPITVHWHDIKNQNLKCYGDSTGKVRAHCNDGQSPYLYVWNTGDTSDVIDNLGAGTYVVTVTDANGCTATNSITFVAPSDLVISVTSTDATCGNADGSATVIASGGTPSYNYIWSPNVGNTPTVNNLPAGSYTVTVKDNNECQKSASIYINDLIVSIAVDSIKNPTCYGGSDGVAVTVATGGIPPYSYQWNTTPTVLDSTLSGISAGTYTCVATDQNGCNAAVTVTLTDPPPVVLTTTSTDVSCSGGSDGTATANVSGNAPPYTFSWSNGQTTQTATGLSAGTYTVLVSDNLGCDTTSIILINEPLPLTITYSLQNVSCFGGNDGQASIQVSGGTSPYSYSWSSGGSNATESNLSAGTYSVTVTDNNNCSISQNITINEPQPLTVSITNTGMVSCNGANDGFAVATANGGTSPYTFVWNSIPTAINDSAYSLGPGTYSVMVIDSNNCTASTNVVITQPALLYSSAYVVSRPLCYGDANGVVAAAAYGGTAPYSYSWNTSPAQTNATATGLAAGSYEVVITDNNGCSDTSTVVLTQPTPLQINISNINHVNCYGGSDGSATVTGVGGTPPYTYSWFTSPVQNTQTAVNLSRGTYTVAVTDANGCVTNRSVSIQEPSDLVPFIISTTDVSCYGGNDGKAYALAAGGTAPYYYQWNTLPPQLNPQADSLYAGTYQVTITDNNGCSDTISATINQPPPLSDTIYSQQISCYGGNDGQATIQVTGGTPGYTFVWNDPNNQTSATATGLSQGYYSVTVTDANNCSLSDFVYVEEPTPLNTTISTLNQVSCTNMSDGWATAHVSGGSSPYYYQWTTNPVQTDSTAINLAPGNYQCFITDANGCNDTVSVTITNPSPIQLSSASTVVSCFGVHDGTASVLVSGGTPGYSYSWNDHYNQITQTAIFLAAGIYQVIVTDAMGCKDSITVSVNQPQPLVAIADSINVLCHGDTNGVLIASISGGTAPATYVWNNGLIGDTLYNMAPDFYTVYAFDAHGCTAFDNTEIVEPESLYIDTLYIKPESCWNGIDGEVAVKIFGGTQPYTYYWNTSPAIQDTLITGLLSGNYTFYVTDTNGCSDSLMVFVPRDTVDLTQAQIVLADSIICPGDSTQISVQNQDTTHTFLYTWNTLPPGEGPFTVSPLVPTYYILTVSDICGNTLQDSALVDLYQLPYVDLNLFKDSSCAPAIFTIGDSSFLQTNYQFVWSINGTQVSTQPIFQTQINNSGIYPVTVQLTSTDGCVNTLADSALIEVFPLPVADFVANPWQSTILQPTIQFNDLSQDAYQWLWNFGDGDTSLLTNPQHTYGDTGTFNVMLIVSNSHGCVDTTYNEVTIKPEFYVEVPNAFTPNPNGPNGGEYNPNQLSNTVFFPYTKYVKDFHMMIFNRWGEMVFETFDLNVGWDGYYRGKLLQQDVYVWKIWITFIDGSTIVKAGDVTLLR